ncbi:MAG: tyrosine--tRNA ligase [bacterium]|nr:tyrosine--tRNA ligase [bacterium]
MTAKSIDEQIAILTRGCEAVYAIDELRKRLEKSAGSGKPLRVKLGMDPTAPDLTLGHTVVLRKLRDFQDLGHKATLIIGDYTAMIGDPTGRSKTRPVLSDDQVHANAQTYLDQAGQVIDLSPDKFEVRRNSEWLSKMNFAEVLAMAGKVTVARMLERDTFAKRQAEGTEIYMHELFYPMMQARDSVVIESDVELGGTDQTFNNLMGRDFQRNAGQPPQIVVIMPILVGLDGHEKMSKSLGNYVGVSECPTDMFGKLMSIPDETMRNYFELLTHVSADRIGELLDAAKTHPRDAKIALAKDIVAQYHGGDPADQAEQEFFRIHGAGKTGLPDDIQDVTLSPDMLTDGSIGAADLLIHCSFAKSKGDARRLISENGARLDGEVLPDPHGKIAVSTGQILQRGKRKFVRLVVEA